MGVIAKIASHKVAKNTSVLFFAQMASRAVGLIYVAALARYVGTEGVGILSTATVLNSLLVLVIAPGLDTLLVRDVAADTRKASRYVSNMLLIRLILAVPFVLAVVGVSSVAGYPPDTVTIIWIYILVYLLDTIGGVLIPVFQAFEKLEYEAISQIVQDLFNIAFSLVAISLGASLAVIALVSVLARLLRLVFVVTVLGRQFVSFRTRPHLEEGWRLLVVSLPFGALLVFHTIQAQLGMFVLSISYSADVVGIYSAANFVIVTLLMLAAAFSKAIFPVLSSLHVRSKTQLTRFYRVAYKYLVVTGFALGVGTLLVGDRAIELVYGEGFAASGEVVRILSVFLFTLVGYANGPLLMATGRQHFFMWTQAAAAVGYAVLLLVLIPPFGAVGAAVAFVIPGIFTFFVHSVAAHRQVDLQMPWQTMIRIGLAAGFMGVTVVIGLSLSVPWLVMALLVAPPAYGAALLLLKVLSRGEFQSLASGSDAPGVASEHAGVIPAVGDVGR